AGVLPALGGTVVGGEENAGGEGPRRRRWRAALGLGRGRRGGGRCRRRGRRGGCCRRRGRRGGRPTRRAGVRRAAARAGILPALGATLLGGEEHAGVEGPRRRRLQAALGLGRRRRGGGRCRRPGRRGGCCRRRGRGGGRASRRGGVRRAAAGAGMWPALGGTV